MSKLILIPILVILCFLVSCEHAFIPDSTDSLELNSSCKEVKTKFYQQEKYERTEKYEAPLRHVIESETKGTINNGSELYAKHLIKVRNTDFTYAEFTVNFIFDVPKEGKKVLTHSLRLQPGEAKEFTQEYLMETEEPIDSEYIVIAPKQNRSKPVTKYRNVTKFKYETVCE